MTGSADDGPLWQPHIRNKLKRRKLANRFKDSKDPFRIVIVRDMWLTGFDAPCLHTMYADKPMQGHGLMQAIARVNRVFRDKPGGLVVDYLGLADQLKHALATYTESGGQGDPTYDTAQAVAMLLEKHGIACDMLHGFNWKKWTTGKPAERLALIPAGQEHILEQEDGKKRFVQVVTELSRAFALCAASDEATEIRDDVSFFQALQAALNKQSEQRQPEDAGADRRRRPAAGVQGHHDRRPGHRRLHRRRAAQAGHLASCRTSSSPRCAGSSTRTSPPSCWRSCSRTNSRSARSGTWCRASSSPRS